MNPAIQSRHLEDEIREVDLDGNAADAWWQLSETSTDYTARTLVKQPQLRVVSIVMAKGAHIPVHRAPGDISVHVLSGRIVFAVGGEDHELGPRKLIAVARSLLHELTALEDSEILLTIGG